MPDSSRWVLVAKPRAVCWVITICSGMFGSNIRNARNTPKPPYCPVGKNLLRKWTAHMKAPPPMLAIISQPLWRKNDERWAEGVRGMVSALASDMVVIQNSKLEYRRSEEHTSELQSRLH